jgi:hypothetical protein
LSGIVFPLGGEPIIDLAPGSESTPFSPPVSKLSDPFITPLGLRRIGSNCRGRRPSITRMLEIL